MHDFCLVKDILGVNDNPGFWAGIITIWLIVILVFQSLELLFDLLKVAHSFLNHRINPAIIS